jgi:hypothetical protein
MTTRADVSPDLRSLLAAATPGPWQECGDEDAKGKFWHVWIGAGMSKRDVAQVFSEADAAYIAAASPGVILANVADGLARLAIGTEETPT